MWVYEATFQYCNWGVFDRGHRGSTIYQNTTTNAFPVWTNQCHSTANLTRAIYPIDITWLKDSELPCRLSAVDGISLPGSARLRVPSTGDSFSLVLPICRT